MKIAPVLAGLTAAVTLAIPSLASAAGPQLDIPDFSHLRAKAVDSTDITLDGFLLRTLAKLAEKSAPEDAASLQVLSDIKSVQIRTFRFDVDDAYNQADIDSVRRQLSAPGWSALMQAQKRQPRELVDVFINTADGKVRGIAVVASDPREFTIVNIVGSLDIDKLAKLEGQFGIPTLSRND